MDIMSHGYQIMSIIVFLSCGSVFTWCLFDRLREEKTIKAEQTWEPNYELPKSRDKVRCKYIYPQNI